MERTKLTIRLPKDRLDEVKAWAKENNVTVTEVIDRYLARLVTRNRDLAPEVTQFAGVLNRATDPRADYREHLYRKHIGRDAS